NYPNSNNVYDSYGDLLAAEKDTTNAIANYQKALAIQDNDETKRKLNELEGKEVFTLTPQQLQQYAGEFDIENFSVTVTFVLRDSALHAIVPDQEESELLPVSPN